MSDRLRELQRQRALAQEQVAWFDREIAQETAGQPSAPAPSAPVGGVPPLRATPQTATADHTEEILAQYSPNPQSTERDVKRGCYIWFAGAMGAVVLFALAIYLIYSRRI
ncbi:MAG: hypothetical protein HYX71_00435 [Opitutae bacterium]|nr:hypothetical protein [Opitutae bacterium]